MSPGLAAASFPDQQRRNAKASGIPLFDMAGARLSGRGCAQLRIVRPPARATLRTALGHSLRRLRGGLPIDILFTDMNLAGHMDGATLARLARDLLPALVVVYTSGSMNAVPQGVPGSAFVPKPYSPDRVGALLSRMARIHA